MINMRTHDNGDLIVRFDVEFPSEDALKNVEALKVSRRIDSVSHSYLTNVSC